MLVFSFMHGAAKLSNFQASISPLFSDIPFLCTCTTVISNQILPIVRLLLLLCRHLSMLAILTYSADYRGCLLDKIVTPKQV